MSRLAIASVFVLAALLALGGLRMFKTPIETAKPPAEPAPAVEPKRDAFAADREPVPAQPVAIDAERAMGYLEEVCKIGPRISGTDGMKKQQELVKRHFETQGAQVELQPFTARQKSRRQPVDMANLIASWHAERQRRVILCSHYDTRPIADQEEDRSRWTQPFLSANDGGSGVALLMELANHLKDLKTEVGIDFVLFDGEEYIFEPNSDKYFYGSEHFAQAYRQSRAGRRYLAAVLLDMIAGRDARFPAEQHSWVQAGGLVQEIWGVAAELKCTAFQNRVGESVLDDHLALNQAGIPAIDIIPEARLAPHFHFQYPHWHRLSDVPANCSGESMAQVGRVLSVWLQRVK
jgi:hypothetical protein